MYFGLSFFLHFLFFFSYLLCDFSEIFPFSCCIRSNPSLHVLGKCSFTEPAFQPHLHFAFLSSSLKRFLLLRQDLNALGLAVYLSLTSGLQVSFSVSSVFRMTGITVTWHLAEAAAPLPFLPVASFLFLPVVLFSIFFLVLWLLSSLSQVLIVSQTGIKISIFLFIVGIIATNQFFG